MRTKKQLDAAIQNSMRQRKDADTVQSLADRLGEEAPRVWNRLRSMVKRGVVSETPARHYHPAMRDSGPRYSYVRREAASA